MKKLFVEHHGKFLSILAISAFALTLIQYGFYVSNELLLTLKQLNILIFILFIIYQLGRIKYAENRSEYIKSRWIDLLLLILILVHTFLYILFPKIYSSFAGFFHILDLNFFYIVMIQIYILVSLVIKASREAHKIAEYRIQPAKVFLFSFLLIILVGTGFLMLPKASYNQITFIDALFTSTSAVCVTGLIVVDTATYFTRFGQLIILALIQIGGLGVMTITTFFAIFFAGGLGIKERVLISDFIEEEKLGQIKSTLTQIILFTLIIESIGAVIFYQGLKDVNMPFGEKVFHSIFHSVSAFCNAGFSTFSNNLMEEFLRNNFITVSTVGTLIILGGLGFGTLSNISQLLVTTFKKRTQRIPILSTQSRIVLITTLFLIVIGTIFTYALEYNNTLKNLTFEQKILASIFQSITTRTAGFNTIPINDILVATSLVYIFLMFIGASPGGTGGGIKTTTAFISGLAIIEFLSGRNKLEVFKRKIPGEIIQRVYVKIAFSVLLLFLALLILSITEKFAFVDILFEVISAFGTVGLSRGITFDLSETGKIVITVIMYIGRVGPITLLTSFAKETVQPKYEYPTEYVSTV